MKQFGRFIIICIVLFVGVWVAGSVYLFSPLDKTATEKDFVIAKGQSLATVASRLEEDGFVRSGLSIRLLLRSRPGATVQAGTYKLAGSMPPQAIINILLEGATDTWVTFLEGWRREEISDELEAELGNEFFDKQQFLILTESKEGMLFPDTYLFPKQATASYIVSVLENTFQKRYQTVAKGSSSSLQHALILASLVEREAREPKDMKIVAGILNNRIKLGMPLQVDATLQYIKGYDKTQKTWWPEPRAADKDLVSTYNTYKNRGLPPAPICNPGTNALEAALKPTDSAYLYYISDRQGNMHYAETLDEHNENIDQYLR